MSGLTQYMINIQAQMKKNFFVGASVCAEKNN